MTTPPQPPPPQGPRARMQDAVMKVMEQVTEQRKEKAQGTQADRERAIRREKRRKPLLIGATLAFIASLLWGVPKWIHPFPAHTGAAAVDDARKAIALAGGLVHRYTARNGHAPETLHEAGLDVPGLTYTKSANTWIIFMDVEGTRLTLKSTDDLAHFKAGH